MRKTKKIKIGGVCYWIRPINEFDLLGLDSYIPIFPIDREHETNWLYKAIDRQNERIAKENEDANLIFLKHIVYRCTKKIKPSLWLRMKSKAWRNQKKALIDILMKDERCLNMLYQYIHSISFDKVTQKVNQTTAESIYATYKGMNYADQFFADSKLNSLEKYAFNRMIHNAGVTAENRRLKANG